LEEPQKQTPKKKNGTIKKKRNAGWIIGVTLASFVLSGGLLFASASTLEGVSVYVAILIVLIIVFIGILFDTIGISVAGAKAPVFHSMAAKKLYGAKQAIWLVNHADKVASICNDVIGDICGVISGAASTLIIISIIGNMQNDPKSWPSLIVSGAVAALTVGGKAIGKTIAVKKGNEIVYKSGVIIRFFSGGKGSSE
jgi:CBS domain containing-hemolysin-like protein